LNLDEAANEKLIEKTINSLKDTVGVFCILERDELNYVQSLNTEHGFILEFQNGSIDHHYQISTLLSRPQTIALLKAYFNSKEDWCAKFEIQKKNIRSSLGRLGYNIGSFIGNFIRGFKEVCNKNK
jgi:hypothetical protein